METGESTESLPTGVNQTVRVVVSLKNIVISIWCACISELRMISDMKIMLLSRINILIIFLQIAVKSILFNEHGLNCNWSFFIAFYYCKVNLN